MKYGVVWVSLLVIACSNKAAQMPSYQKGAAHFESPALRYRVLGFGCTPIPLKCSKPDSLVVPKGPDQEAITEHLKKNSDWLQEKTAFFLQYKHLSVAEREERWQKLQSDAQLKKKHTALQQWLTQKAKEPVGLEKEKEASLVRFSLSVTINAPRERVDDEVPYTPNPARREGAVPKEGWRAAY